MSDSALGVVTEQVDGHRVRLRRPHDLRFLSDYGRVFSVLDDQDSGNLCFGLDGDQGRVFVKYAGASTTRYEGRVVDAVAQLRHAAEIYRDLAHPSLVRLRDAVELAEGFALVFDWVDAVPLGRQYDRRNEMDGLDLAARIDAVQQILDFSAHAARRGWIAIDLYDGSVMVDPRSGRVTLCDLNAYATAPVWNTMGRMWGSDRFMSPEEYELGAELDQVTNVVALGSLAHTFLGDDATKSRSSWTGSNALWRVAERARAPRREDRWPSVAALADAWRSASAVDARHE